MKMERKIVGKWKNREIGTCCACCEILRDMKYP
jgi:hypothetical protein